MAAPSIPKRLLEILRDSFSPGELARLVHWELRGWLHNIARPMGTHDEQVADVIDWAVRQGRMDELIRSAARGRPSRQDIQDLLTDWDGLSARPDQSGIPLPVVSLAAKFDEIRMETAPGEGRDRERREVSLNLLKSLSHYGAEIESWCLHPNPGIRLAAVLELEREPKPEYLRWLSERVTVEEPFIGLRAAAALRRAAEKLDDKAMGAVLSVVTDSLAGLARVPESADRLAQHREALAIPARREDNDSRRRPGARNLEEARS
jgi:hypothetical protein